MSRLLPDWIDAYMAYVDNTEPPDLYKIWTAIFCISSCLKRKCFLQWGMFRCYPNIYVVLVGPPAIGKGVAMIPGFEMLNDLNVRMAADVSTKEALIRELNRSNDDTGRNPEGNLEFHSSMIIFTQELSVFLGYGNLDLMGYLTDWYDCKPRWNYATKDRTLSDDVINVWVSLFGATTPSMIQDALPTESIGLGLTSRIIFVYEHKEGKCIPIPFLSEDQESLRPLILSDLEQVLMLRGQFRYTSKFLSKFIDWFNYQKANPPFKDERLGGYSRRRRIHLLKMSMIMCASRTDEMLITEADFDRALYVLGQTEVKMPNVFSGVGKNPVAPTMHRAAAIVDGMGVIGYQELYAMLSNDVDSMGFDRIIQSLKTIGCVEMGKDVHGNIVLMKGSVDINLVSR